jgi:hypothetical protein
VDDASLLFDRPEVQSSSRPVNRVAAVRVDDSEIDRQFRVHPRVGAYCPHWRSVFSSVFKEPKLRHAPATVEILAGLHRSALVPSAPFRRL